MNSAWMLPQLFLLPAFLAILILLFSSARVLLRLLAAGSVISSLSGLVSAIWVLRRGVPVRAWGDWLMLDALSAWHLAVMSAVFALSALYALSYFGPEIESGKIGRPAARRLASLWLGSQAAMHLVLVSNNLGVMWVGIEATTLLTAFLICIHASPTSLEAMWKYLLMCSVGVALAFMGTLLLAAATQGAGIEGTQALLWTNLRENAANLHPQLVKIAFLFMVAGYGTKAGLAPLHNWLPDAHSQAPSPVSAVFSGFLLNAALYGILRVLPVAESLPGAAGWAREVLVALGLISIFVAAVFMATQSDIKRLLAYSSVEHMGIIALGAGIGGVGPAVAMFHMLGNSLGKTAGFFSAGAVGRAAGTYDMRALRQAGRISSLWGGALAASLLALVGTAPFSLFLSEFLMLQAAFSSGRFVTGTLFLAGLVLVFVGTLRHVISLLWEPRLQEDESHVPRAPRPSWWEAALVIAPLGALLVLGVFVPSRLWQVFDAAARIVGGGS